MKKGSLEYRQPDPHADPPDDDAEAASRFGTLVRLARDVSRDQRIRYMITGGITSIVYYSTFSAGWLLLHGRIPYLVMAVFANLSSAFLTYPIYRIAVFRASGPWVRSFIRFYAVFIWGLFFSLGGLPLLIEVFGINVLLSQAIILVASPLINYQLHKLWAFRRRT